MPASSKEVIELFESATGVTADVSGQTWHPGNRRAFNAICQVRKSLEAYVTLLVSPRRHWSLEEIAECLRSDVKELNNLENKFNFEKEVFE